MVEVLKSFEGVASRLNTLVLVVPGVAMVALGLFVWLGGLGFRRVLCALIGGMLGAVAALCVINQDELIAAASAVAVAGAAAVFQRFFAALLLGLLALGIAFVVLGRPGLLEYHGTLVAAENFSQSDQRLNVSDSLRIVHAYGLDLTDGIRYAARKLAPIHWAIIAAVAAGMLALGVLFRHLGGALSCAILGTALIFAGLVLLLIFKGSGPVARMQASPAFYGLIFTGMAAFGTLEQFALYRWTERRNPRTRSGKAPPADGGSKRSWRDR